MSNTGYQNRKELFEDLRFIQNEIEKHQMDIVKRNELEEEEHCLIDRLKELGYKTWSIGVVEFLIRELLRINKI